MAGQQRAMEGWLTVVDWKHTWNMMDQQLFFQRASFNITAFQHSVGAWMLYITIHARGPRGFNKATR